jgi:small subunit ribosomal protein S1
MEYKEGGRRLLVSNRAILEEARRNELEELRKTLVVGAVLKGTVVSIRDFGAFVDIGGIQALLPVSEISRARVEKAEEALSVGQEVEVAVLKLDWKNDRFTVSMKSLLADPWDRAKERYPVDSRHVGTVARVADFGVFVALEPGIDGLVHVSELRAASRSPDGRSETPKVGLEMSVKVLGVDPSKRRISLKPALAPEEDAAARAYMDSTPDGETYNPFANLLGKKRG